jgi:DNA-binding transcriptional MerR regulator
MRISELSRRSGVPVGTIKFYVREGLLPPGELTARNQAEYGEHHLRRLRFIRVLTGIVQMDLSSVRDLLLAIEYEHLPLHDLFDVVNEALVPQAKVAMPSPSLAPARSDVDELVDRLGWRVAPDAAARDILAQVVAALHDLGCDCDIDFFLPFAAAADQLVVQELDLLPAGREADARAAAVARAALLAVAMAAMRRMAHEHHLAVRYADVA